MSDQVGSSLLIPKIPTPMPDLVGSGRLAKFLDRVGLTGVDSKLEWDKFKDRT